LGGGGGQALPLSLAQRATAAAARQTCTGPASDVVRAARGAERWGP